MNTQTPYILIADDESPARNRLHTLLKDIEGGFVVLEAKNGHEVLAMAHQYAIDIVLLDIRMPGLDGLETAQHLNKMAKPPAIIFTTAFDAYALQAFDLNAIDYLLKPIRAERLKMAIDKARVLLPHQVQALTPLIPTRSHISIVERGRVQLISIQDVIYFRAELKYITVRTTQKAYLLDDTLNNLEQIFGSMFIRLHRNCLVSQAYIAGFDKRLLSSHEQYPQDQENSMEDAKEKQWVALLKGLPEVIPVSRRQQHLIRTFILQ
jgi:two-component system response regulator AlgR